MNPRRPIGVLQRGEGLSQGVPLLSIGRLGVINDSQAHGYALFYSHPD